MSRRANATTGHARPDSPPLPAGGPCRTCVGCRARSARGDLLRVVAVEGRLVPDPRRVLPGRGASVHPDPACLDRAERRKAFVRALRVPGPVAADELRSYLQEIVKSSPETEAGRVKT